MGEYHGRTELILIQKAVCHLSHEMRQEYHEGRQLIYHCVEEYEEARQQTL